MLGLLRHPIYLRLFVAQVVALLGTGLLSVALGLLAYELAPGRAGLVLGTAFTIKMLAYVLLSPLASALAENLPRKAVLIGADLVRVAVALMLPFIGAVWQIYLLIFVLQAASAAFTPAFQAVIPDVLSDEKDYTRALSLSRLAYDMENLLSPALAGGLLLVMDFHGLFGATGVGFAISALLVALTRLPVHRRPPQPRPFRERLVRGSRIYLATPRLRGFLMLNFSAAAVSAFVLVNTVVIVRVGYGGSAGDVAYAYAAFGAGSMLAALALPRLLERLADRSAMIAAAFGLSALALAQSAYGLAGGILSWGLFLASWGLSGLFYSAILTPSGRLLRQSASARDRPAVFAAQFALSHACWLVTYPIAGWVGNAYGMPVAMAVLGGLALAGAVAAVVFWPSGGGRVDAGI